MPATLSAVLPLLSKYDTLVEVVGGDAAEDIVELEEDTTAVLDEVSALDPEET